MHHARRSSRRRQHAQVRAVPGQRRRPPRLRGRARRAQGRRHHDQGQSRSSSSGNLYQSNAMVGQRIMKEIGATGIPVINVANACATGSTAFREAYYAVASGAYDVALAVGSEQMGKMGLLGAGGGGDRAYSTEGVMGTGLHARRLRTGRRRAHAQVRHDAGAVRQGRRQEPRARRCTTPTPSTRRRRRSRKSSTRASVAWPNTLYMCCPTGDGAAAAILCRRRRRSSTRRSRSGSPPPCSPPTRARERDPTMPDINTLTRNAAEGGVREGRHRPRGPGPGRAARLLRDGGAAALREPRPLRRGRGRQA